MYGGFFEILAASLTFAFFVGETSVSGHHELLLLYAAIFACLVAAIAQPRRTTRIRDVQFAIVIVTELQLVAAAVVWNLGLRESLDGIAPRYVAGAISLSGGALVASIALLVLRFSEGKGRTRQGGRDGSRDAAEAPEVR